MIKLDFVFLFCFVCQLHFAIVAIQKEQETRNTQKCDLVNPGVLLIGVFFLKSNILVSLITILIIGEYSKRGKLRNPIFGSSCSS